MNILLTGGVGYIGSHAAVILSQAGHEVVLFDNFCNSHKSVLGQLQKILSKALPCVEGDVRNTELLTKVLQDYKIDAVIHFAGLKAVGESVEKPIEYYANNVSGLISLLEAMKSAEIRALVFSSSATVYGPPQYLPINEDHPTGAINPYGRSKLHIEEILSDVAFSDSTWRIACLRYFNPVGAHESGLIGEASIGAPNNLLPSVSRVAVGKFPELSVFGDCYETHDGTCIRDYIHVMDLANGHLAALDFLVQNLGWHAFNLGAGTGYSVLDMIHAFEIESGKKVPFSIKSARFGDVAACYADPSKAKILLGWCAQRNLSEICRSEWAFQVQSSIHNEIN